MEEEFCRKDIADLALFCVVGCLPVGQVGPPEARTVLDQVLWFSRDRMLQVEHGAVVAKILKQGKRTSFSSNGICDGSDVMTITVGLARLVQK